MERARGRCGRFIHGVWFGGAGDHHQCNLHDQDGAGRQRSQWERRRGHPHGRSSWQRQRQRRRRWRQQQQQQHRHWRPQLRPLCRAAGVRVQGHLRGLRRRRGVGHRSDHRERHDRIHLHPRMLWARRVPAAPAQAAAARPRHPRLCAGAAAPRLQHRRRGRVPRRVGADGDGVRAVPAPGGLLVAHPRDLPRARPRPRRAQQVLLCHPRPGGAPARASGGRSPDGHAPAAGTAAHDDGDAAHEPCGRCGRDATARGRRRRRRARARLASDD